MTAALFEAAEAARRIVAAHEAWERDRKFSSWQDYICVARDDSVTVARAFLALPEVQAAAHWRPALAGQK